MSAPNRLDLLLNGQSPIVLTGIDFVRILDECEQTTFWIYFLVDPEDVDPSFSTELPGPDAIEITSISGGEAVPQVPVISTALATDTDSMRNVLEVVTDFPGDFSRYRLFIDDVRIDPFFNNVEFSFKQACPPDVQLDCAEPPPDCPPEDEVDFPIDYLARDYNSFKRALLDFANQRYPDWVNGTEADVGMMVMELMAALGDDLSYTQDRYAREAYLDTATQRRSLRRHSRLVDYVIHDGRLAKTFLDFQVKEGIGAVELDVGSRVWAIPDNGDPLAFEVGLGLHDTGDDGLGHYTVHTDWNSLEPHIFHEDAACLPEGSTEIFVKGHVPVPETAWDVENQDKRVLLHTLDPDDPEVNERRILVRVVEVEHETDPLLMEDITRIVWDEADATPFQLDLENTVVRANIVPATAGETFTEEFTIGENEEGLPEAVERQGPLNELNLDRSVTFLYSLRATEAGGLGWLGTDLRMTMPEVDLQEVEIDSPLETTAWIFRRSLLESRQFDEHFTLDDGTWRRVKKFRRAGFEFEHQDYASGTGYTIRFGDGEFAKIPARGTRFIVRYRLGPGVRANVSPDTLIHLITPGTEGTTDESDFDLDEIEAVTNPLAVTDGVDVENLDTVRQLVPDAWRAIKFRAVRPEDYTEFAERRPWVQRANTCFRWTGSWLSVFTTPDPLGTFVLTDENRLDLENALDCVRQAGREVIVRDPRFVPIDLEIPICVEASAYPGQVIQRVKDALLGTRGPRGIKGFFDPDNFTFGTPLRRSALEAAIQAVPGVRAVGRMRIRARGVEGFRDFDELRFVVADNEVIRLENSRNFPERGTLRLVVEEGA